MCTGRYKELQICAVAVMPSQRFLHQTCSIVPFLRLCFLDGFFCRFATRNNNCARPLTSRPLDVYNVPKPPFWVMPCMAWPPTQISTVLFCRVTLDVLVSIGIVVVAGVDVLKKIKIWGMSANRTASNRSSNKATTCVRQMRKCTHNCLGKEACSAFSLFCCFTWSFWSFENHPPSNVCDNLALTSRWCCSNFEIALTTLHKELCPWRNLWYVLEKKTNRLDFVRNVIRTHNVNVRASIFSSCRARDDLYFGAYFVQIIS